MSKGADDLMLGISGMLGIAMGCFVVCSIFTMVMVNDPSPAFFEPSMFTGDIPPVSMAVPLENNPVVTFARYSSNNQHGPFSKIVYVGKAGVRLPKQIQCTVTPTGYICDVWPTLRCTGLRFNDTVVTKEGLVVKLAPGAIVPETGVLTLTSVVYNTGTIERIFVDLIGNQLHAIAFGIYVAFGFPCDVVSNAIDIFNSF